MTGKFTPAKTNYNGYLNPANCTLERFKPLIHFLNERCHVNTAITAQAYLQVDPFREYYSTLLNSTLLDNPRMIGKISGQSIMNIADDVNLILGFLWDKFADVQPNEDFTQFFEKIQFQAAISLPPMSKNKLKLE